MKRRACRAVEWKQGYGSGDAVALRDAWPGSPIFTMVLQGSCPRSGSLSRGYSSKRCEQVPHETEGQSSFGS